MSAGPARCREPCPPARGSMSRATGQAIPGMVLAVARGLSPRTTARRLSGRQGRPLTPSSGPEGDLVVDGVEGVLRQLLGGLHLAVPDRAAVVGLAGRVGQDVVDIQAGRPAERRADVVVDTGARGGATGAVD